MQVISSAADLATLRPTLVGPVGFVPTMGALHRGHTALMARARRECGAAAVSIFVNPTQFGPAEDFARYPRDLPKDLETCEKAGVDLVFTPGPADIYPTGFSTYLEVHGLQDRWEGATRPGHFRGVATVVAILFRMVAADRAYFGEKDYQQLQIVRRLSEDLRLGVEVVGCPTVREADGLALSSRNVYLSPEDRKRATALYRALQAAQHELARGETSGEALSATMGGMVGQTPGIELDYAAVVDPSTLEPVGRVTREARALIAARLGGVHLIDNLALIP